MLIKVLAVAIAGALHMLGFAPSELWGLQLLGLAALAATLGQLQASEPRSLAKQGFVLGWSFGLGWFLVGVSWVYVSMHEVGGMPSWMAAIAAVLLAAYLALFPALACAVYCRFLPGLAWWQSILLFAAVHGLSDWARGWVLTGFPWGAMGYAHTASPLSAFAPLGGVYAVGAAAAAMAALIAGFANRGVPMALRTKALACALLLAVASIGLKTLNFASAQGAPVSVRLMQGGIPQDLKFNPQRTLAAQKLYTDWVESSSAAVNVIPETAWASYWNPQETAEAKRLQALVQSKNTVVALGAVARLGDLPGNALFWLDAKSTPAPYIKQHLVPFGEYIPPMFGWFVAMMNIPLGNFAQGLANQPIFTLGEARFAFNICYEDVFGAELLPPIQSQGANVLVNVSNLAWFGQSWAMPQHLQIAQMRSMETARPMLRATNTGVTAHIDHHGKVLAQLALDKPAVLDVQVQPTAGLTPFARFGNWPIVLICVSVIVAFGILGNRASRR